MAGFDHESLHLRAAAFAAALAACALIPQQSAAQDSEEGTADETIEEIVVTAAYREQGLQDVPVSISAVTGDSDLGGTALLLIYALVRYRRRLGRHLAGRVTLVALALILGTASVTGLTVPDWANDHKAAIEQAVEDEVITREHADWLLEGLDKGYLSERGFALDDKAVQRRGTVADNGASVEIGHGAVVIAAITSCTNTSNPYTMIGAGLVAKKAVEKGTFRKDLFYRLNVIAIGVPPLRERASDIPLLMNWCLSRFSKILGKPAPTLTLTPISLSPM